MISFLIAQSHTMIANFFAISVTIKVQMVSFFCISCLITTNYGKELQLKNNKVVDLGEFPILANLKRANFKEFVIYL